MGFVGSFVGFVVLICLSWFVVAIGSQADGGDGDFLVLKQLHWDMGFCGEFCLLCGLVCSSYLL